MRNSPLTELNHLARELLPTTASSSLPSTTSTPATRSLRAQLERDKSRIAELERELQHARESAAEAALAQSALARDALDGAVRDGCAAREALEHALVDADAREAETRRALRECEDIVDAVSMERESLEREVSRLRAEAEMWRSRCEEAYVKADDSEQRARKIRNGELLAALRDRIVDLQSELRAEKSAGDHARKIFEKRMFEKDVEVMCIRDRARELGMCMELLDDKIAAAK
jgi:predicted RNase H-like nuclease (RuvC/YqgF family)